MARKKLPKEQTKLKTLMEKKGVGPGELYHTIKRMYPSHPVSRAQIMRIYHGQLKNYQLSTLYRICNALKVKPNSITDTSEVDKIL